jgi:hypothetical protein
LDRRDTHLYANHFEQAQLQLTREPLPLCQLKLNPEITDIFDFKFEDIQMVLAMSHTLLLKHPSQFKSIREYKMAWQGIEVVHVVAMDKNNCLL